MTVNKRKKSVRQRALTTHGKGSMKKRRGSGNKGGAGRGGSGKRAGSKKPSLLWGRDRKAKIGFSSKHPSKEITPVNISAIDKKITAYLQKGLAKKESDAFVINLSDIGYNKLLGSGQVNAKYLITVEAASKNAVEAVQKAGGKVILPT